MCEGDRPVTPGAQRMAGAAIRSRSLRMASGGLLATSTGAYMIARRAGSRGGGPGARGFQLDTAGRRVLASPSDVGSRMSVLRFGSSRGRSCLCGRGVRRIGFPTSYRV